MVNQLSLEHGERRIRLSGMPGFTVMWIGQVISLVGSAMTSFAIMVWLWEKTGRATPFALYGTATIATTIAASLLAGALVDRWDRKLSMALSDMAAALATAIMLVLHSLDALEVWHLYALAAFTGFFGAFQFPALSAAVTLMLSKRHYARASAMRSMAETASGIFAPAVAVVLLRTIGIRGVFVIDIATFAIALAALLVVHIPKPQPVSEGQAGKESIWKESLYGLKYLYERPSLFGLLMVFFASNINLGFVNVLRTPLVLARTGGDEVALGIVKSAVAAGGLAGGLVMIVWDGPKSRMRGIFIGLALVAISTIAMGLGHNVVVWAVAGGLTWMILLIQNSFSQAFWQSKVAPTVQGRVFAARSMISGVTAPLAAVIAGPLADKVFEPQVSGGGLLGSLFGRVVGTGPGSGLSLMFVFSGVLALVATIVGYGVRVVREGETILPDHDAASASE
ncbi:MAG: MFS transporter [Firmicutes bacterium]|nr:MFS transporter [Bacillota bacterium]